MGNKSLFCWYKGGKYDKNWAALPILAQSSTRLARNPAATTRHDLAGAYSSKANSQKIPRGGDLVDQETHSTIAIIEPNNWTQLDNITRKVSKLPVGKQAEFDLTKVKFLNSSGVLMLFLLCIEAYNRTGIRVRITNVDSKIQRYLRKIKFYDYDPVHATA